MITKFYLPLLKSKAGEFEALFMLPPKYKKNIVPLFEVTPREYDHDAKKKPKTLKEHLISFCKKVTKKWPTNRCFIDTSLIDDQEVDGMKCIEFIFDELVAKDICPMPVVRISTNVHLIEAISYIIDSNSIEDVGIRVTINDVTSSSFGENLNNLLESLGISVDNCHMIFDLENSDFSKKEDFADGILSELKDFPNLYQWKSFTLVGGAFPGMGKIKTDVQLVSRDDWKFYTHFINRLSQENFYRPVNYGDYSIVTPGYFEFDPKRMSRSANIRYTHDESWLVIKGKALKVSADWQQYYAQAKKIVESEYYFGQDYSEGDLHIKKCAEKKTTTGNSNTWMKVGNNHHFTKVLNDLFAKSL